MTIIDEASENLTALRKLYNEVVGKGDVLGDAAAYLSGNSSIITNSKYGEQMKEYLWDAARYLFEMKQNEEVIQGNLCRDDGGRFSNCGGSSDVAHDAELEKLTTSSEIQDHANKLFPHTAFRLDITNASNVRMVCHPEAAKAVVTQFAKLHREFPQAADNIESVSMFDPDDVNKNTWARANAANGYSTKTGRIELSATKFGNIDELKQALKSSVEKGFHPKGCDTIESIFTHEFGHIVYERLKQAHDKVLVPYVEKVGYAQYGFGTIAGTVAQWNKEQRATGLSDYAKPISYKIDAVNKKLIPIRGNPRDDPERDERFAEAFASLHHTVPKEQCAMVKNMSKLLNRIGDESSWMPITEAKSLRSAYQMDHGYADKYGNWVKPEPNEDDAKAAEAFKQLRIDIGLKPEKPAKRSRKA